MTRRLVTVKTLLGGDRLETAEEAEHRAVEKAVAEVEDETPADAQSAENIFDALSGLEAARDAGKIGKIS